jgi:hypothetical protein
MHTNWRHLRHRVLLDRAERNEFEREYCDFDQPDLRTLRKTKSDLQSETGLVYIAAFGKDGLTTNVNGLCEWFQNLNNTANIRLMLYLSRNNLHVYDMPKLITAIQDFKTNSLKSSIVSEEYALVADWYSAKFDKEQ